MATDEDAELADRLAEAGFGRQASLFRAMSRPEPRAYVIFPTGLVDEWGGRWFLDELTRLGAGPLLAWSHRIPFNRDAANACRRDLTRQWFRTPRCSDALCDRMNELDDGGFISTWYSAFREGFPGGRREMSLSPCAEILRDADDATLDRFIDGLDAIDFALVRIHEVVIGQARFPIEAEPVSPQLPLLTFREIPA